MILGYVTHQLQSPALVRLIREISLIIQEIRIILALRLKRTEQIAVGLIAQAVAPREFLVAHTHIS